MKVFFSYAHDDNVPFVKRVHADVEKAGHTVWFDRREIRPNDDWRRRIIQGLQDTGWTFAFLSPHAVRPDSVCRDEAAITFGETGWALTPVLVEAVPDRDLPVLPGHVQMLDLTGWREHGPIGSPAFEAWYAPHRAALLGILADDSNARYAAEMEEIARRLNPPAAQRAEIERLTDGFVGRQWLLDQVEAWRRDPGRSHLLWLTADPGMGKSAFTAWLARMHHANVVALRLCSYAGVDRYPVRVLSALAFQLARRLADYRAILLHDLPAAGQPLPANPLEAAKLLLTEPLGTGGAIDGGRRADPFLVVVDGLDETVVDGASALTALLVEIAPLLPVWMSLMVTSRPDSPVREMLTHAHNLHIGAEDADNAADLGVYVRGWLGGLKPPPAELEATVGRVVRAAEGNMTYLRALQAMNADHPVAFDKLPEGLGPLFYRWLERPAPTEADYLVLRPLLDVLTASHLPVPPSVLAEAAGLSDFETKARLRRLGSLFRPRQLAGGGEGIVPFHLSLRDWLAGVPPFDPGRFAADVAEGRQRLLRVLWPRVAAEGAADDAYLLGELPAVVERHDPGALRHLLAGGGGWPAAHAWLRRIEATLRARFGWPTLLAWLDLHARLAAAWGDTAARDGMIATADRGDALMTTGDVKGAEAAYRAGMAIAERLAAADPGNAEWQRDLSVSHNKIGDVLRAQGDLTGALDAIRAAMAIRERLAAADAGNAEWQRDLSVSHERIGGVLVAQGNLTGALAAFRADMTIAERLAAADPGNADWQRDLSISHERIGGVLVAQGDLTGALAAFRAAMAIAERLAAADPGNAQWQRGLSISHERIGEVLVAQGDLTGALAAFRAAMAIAERLAASDPGNAEWQRDLSISHERIGGVLVAQGDLTGALAAFRAAMAIAERLTAADPGNADWQRDLSISHERIGDVLVAQGDLAGALAAFRAGMAIAGRLAATDPGDAGWQCDLSISHDRIGNVLVAQGDLAGALAAYRAGMAILERLTAADAGNAEWQRDLSVSHNRIGDVLVAQGDLTGALAAYRADMAIAERLAAADPGNAEWQRDLSISHERIGDVLVAQGDLTGALAAHRAAMAIRERLTADDPGNAGWQRDLSVSHNRIGDVLVAQGDLTGALAAYRADMAIAERLAAADPGNAVSQRDLFVSLHRITTLLLQAGVRDAACPMARRLEAQARRLANRFPQDRECDKYLRIARALVARACGPAA